MLWHLCIPFFSVMASSVFLLSVCRQDMNFQRPGNLEIKKSREQKSSNPEITGSGDCTSEYPDITRSEIRETWEMQGC